MDSHRQKQPFMQSSSSTDLPSLRRSLRRQRRALSTRQRQQVGAAATRRLCRQPVFQRAQHVGIYLDDFGEVPTQAMIQLCFQHGKTVYLPQVRQFDQRLLFVRINRQQYQNRRFARHRLGMLEPRQSRGQSVKKLQLLIMPLLGFDGTGTRLGMGGGYYDRTLARCPARPFRVGLAYDFQQVERLQRQVWDQPLDAALVAGRWLSF